MLNTKPMARRIQALEARSSDKMTVTVKFVEAAPDYIGPVVTCTITEGKDQ